MFGILRLGQVVMLFDSWIKFYNTSIKHADFTINYSEMRKDTEKILIKLLRFFDWDINQDYTYFIYSAAGFLSSAG